MRPPCSLLYSCSEYTDSVRLNRCSGSFSHYRAASSLGRHGDEAMRRRPTPSHEIARKRNRMPSRLTTMKQI
ncbi:hypothetical protein PsYK624_011730 [Phanerochaete sordida]|uniref:Uncharacterized protein n=1 Tax=Phanerochaete sordida TaxID=48140 RepID=A0A9P3FYW2_9APHY|nr:hypothetical protein PsYK624_011730 [Phanerochaete sordida]